jgi:hypothetical protein
MFQLLADESAGRGIYLRVRGMALGLAVHLTAILALAGQRWLVALLAAFSTVVPSPAPAANDILTILAPPPGKPAPARALSFRTGETEQMAPGAPLKIEDGTDIAFDADDTRQLLPVLAAFDGLIVFVPILDRVHPHAAFRPDGSPTALPATLDHWVRIRLPNPSWWPEIDALCSVANPDGTLEAVAVFPPAYRSKLGAAVQTRMAELKSSGRIVGGGLRLEAGRPAGVVVRAITLARLGQIG